MPGDLEQVLHTCCVEHLITSSLITWFPLSALRIFAMVSFWRSPCVCQTSAPKQSHI